MSQTDFFSLKLKPDLLKNIRSLGFEEMTPIQAQSLPHILIGKDVIGQAKTGSGKTAAFGLGLLHHLAIKNYRVQSLVLCPTRELADQVAKVIRPFPVKFTKRDIFTLYYDLKLETNPAMKNQSELYIETSTNVEEENNPLPGNWIIYKPSDLERAKLTPLEDSIYVIQFIPEEYYSLDPDYDLKQLNYIFRNMGGIVKSEQYSIKVLKEDSYY